MACLALRIVSGIVPVDLLMRIVTRRAPDTGIVRIVAFAARKPVGLKPDVTYAELTGTGDLIPSAMALAAEVRGVLGRHLAKIRHLRQFGIALFDPRQVIFRRSVAAFALHAGR